jgi:hypothetical protein
MDGNRLSVDHMRSAVVHYRMVADRAKVNADLAKDAVGRDWLLSLARSITTLADTLQSLTRIPNSAWFLSG